MAELGNPKNTIEVLQKYQFHFAKKFGQNFLIDTHVLDKIVRAAEITPEDYVLEIGPGIGTLTQYLCESAKHVFAVEIDDNLIPILQDTLSPYDNVTVIHNDVLKLDINKLVEEKCEGKRIKVVANLPYYITTPILMGLFESHVPMESVTVMVQKEVAQRMQALPGGKDYGALSLAVQFYAEPYIVANVPPNCFMPRPNVGSAVIRLTRHKEVPVQVNDEKLMFKIIRARHGGYNVPKHSTAREVIRLRREGKHVVIGLITDQSPNRNEAHHWTTFLNQDTVFMDGGERIARMMNYPVFYCELEKRGRGYCKAYFDLLTETPKQTAEGEITELFVRRLEQTIRRAPAYWFWSHKRWKLTREDLKKQHE